MMFSLDSIARHFFRMITNLPYDPKKRPRYIPSNPNAFMFTLQIKFSVDLGQRRLGKSWRTSCGAVVLLRRCKNCRGTILSNLIYGPLLFVSTFTGCSDQGYPHFLRNIHAPRTSLFLPEGNENDGVRISSFNITTDSGELHGQDKERLDPSKVCVCFPSIVFWSNEYRGSCLLWHFRSRLFSLPWMALGGRDMHFSDFWFDFLQSYLSDKLPFLFITDKPLALV